MALKSDSYYHTLVEDQLRALGLTDPPVELAAVARRLGIPVHAYPFPPWFTAALVYEDGMPVVIMNASRDDTTRRHALGHVLGHMLVLITDSAERFPKDTVDEHRDAELIADEFETPGFMVRDQAAKWFNDYGYLAGLFGVSETRMFEKMRDLGLIKSRGIIWDY